MCYILQDFKYNYNSLWYYNNRQLNTTFLYQCVVLSMRSHDPKDVSLLKVLNICIFLMSILYRYYCTVITFTCISIYKIIKTPLCNLFFLVLFNAKGRQYDFICQGGQGISRIKIPDKSKDIISIICRWHLGESFQISWIV